MDTSPLTSFCFSRSSNHYQRKTFISGHKKIDTSISTVSKKKNSNENDISNTVDLKKSLGDDSSNMCFNTRSFKMSPTTSLAAELSGNFYIDKSPVLSTPRRSLLLKFSCEHQTTPVLDSLKDHDSYKFDSLVMDNVNTITPCSSSPVETMDYSPLPYKHITMAFNARQCEVLKDQNSHLYVDAETRDYCCMKSPNSTLNDITNSIELNNDIMDDSSMTSECLRIASSSLGAVYNKEDVDDNQIKNEGETCIALNDLFTSSPNPSRFPVENLLESDRLQTFTKPLFSRYSIALETSPLSFMNDNDMDYRAVKWRRTQSLYQNSYDFLSTKHEGQDNSHLSLQASLEFNSNDCRILPCFSIKDDRLKRIDSDIFVKLLDGHYHDQCDEYVIVDCRFEYEYNGGHIIGAVNINTKDALDALFLNNPKTRRCLIVFHCEYSSHRAPRLALYLRNRDRQLNMQRSFYEKYKERCEPQNYVEMNDSLHKSVCAREMNNFRKNTKFLRTQTYTYGQMDVIHTDVM
ncbi:hypothetical protein PCANB_001366 [Pneumocystis canis]|nr:hypothetical protein PCK1_001352 [Pneumocystis canis]KAG5436956.1 hypothetical protein PCANB_001366 [Pneumocystis canis]